MNMNFIRKLPVPKEIKEMYPVSNYLKEIKEKRDNEIKDVFLGKSDKFIIIIGPCSSDRIDSVLSYLKLLKDIEEKVKDKIIIIPRIYTNKPRTTGTGYMGMLHQPNPEKEPDLLKGIKEIRKLHLKALELYHFTCADELLYPDNFRYLSDLLSYVAVGARSVEDQYHRLTSSGLSIPVGMKNPLSGDLDSVVNAIKSANISHAFLYRGWEVVSCGNSLAHAVLRGYKENEESKDNYHKNDIISLYDKMKNENTNSLSCIIDCSHDNSSKDYLKQIDVALAIMKTRNEDKLVKEFVKGLMIESYILDGAQKENGKEYGKSITDSCLGIDKTRKLIESIYQML